MFRNRYIKHFLTLFLVATSTLSVFAVCPDNETLTQNTSQRIRTSIHCGLGPLHTDNSYFRVFDMVEEGIEGSFNISNVEFGIFEATSAPGLIQTVFVNLYMLTGEFTLANLTPIHGEEIAVPDQSFTVFNVQLGQNVSIPSNSKLVMEIFTPSGVSNGNQIAIGGNRDGDSSSAYRLGGCTNNELTVAGYNVIMNIIGCENPVTAPLVPTMSEWGIICLGMIMLIFGAVSVGQRQTVIV